MKNKTVLVTGSRGFLGKQLVIDLTTAGATVLEYDKSGTMGVTTEEFNDGLSNVSDRSLDYIFHCAVRTQAGSYSREYPADTISNNLLMNQQMINYWSSSQHQAKFVSFGSSCAYNTSMSRNESSYLEGQPEQDYWTYGWIKRMLLVSMRAYAEQHGLHYLYFIPCSLYGPNFKPFDKHLIPTLIREVYASIILEQKHPVLFGDGTQVRQALFVKDASKAIIDMSQKYTNQSINLCPRITRSIVDYTKAICRTLDYDFKLVKYDMRQHKGMFRPNMIQNHKIYETPLQDAIDETATYYKELRAHELHR